MATKILLTLLLLASPVLAAQICIDATCRTTTPRQDAGALYDCTEQTKVNCTAQQARDYVLDGFVGVLDRWADNRERILGTQAGINKGFLHAVAQEPSLSLATKCTVMADEGVQAAYESIYNVTCP